MPAEATARGGRAARTVHEAGPTPVRARPAPEAREPARRRTGTPARPRRTRRTPRGPPFPPPPAYRAEARRFGVGGRRGRRRRGPRGGRGRRGTAAPPGARDRPPPGRRPLARPAPGRRDPLPAPARPTQPSEPILLPKLRIRLADFPYLHCSIDQRLFTLETGCGYRYDPRRRSTHSPAFSRAGRSSPDAAGDAALYGAAAPSSGQADSRDPAPYQEKKTLPGAPAGVCGLARFAARTATKTEGSASGFGNIDPIPFRPGGEAPPREEGGARHRSERNFPGA